MTPNKKVLLCLSGGIDSSLAALFLIEQGYEVHSVTFRTWDYISESCWEKQKGCCSIDAIAEAKNFAEKLGITHQVLDLRSHFGNTVIKEFVNEYIAGRTPNPCVRCNAVTKWGEVINLANDLGCYYVSTGHYAQVRFENGRYVLSSGVDETKDQSYFLWMLTQDNLSRTIFPLGGYRKTEIREIAEKRGLVKLTKKRESQEICFIPENNYRDFLKEQVPDIDKKIGKGNFLSVDGKVIGKHNGYPFYTIGQRKGLGIALGKPQFVIAIKPETNEVVIGDLDKLERNIINVKDVNLIKFKRLENEIEVDLKIRFRTTPVKAILSVEEDVYKFVTTAKVFAVTPGQSAVFYQGKDILGGGIII